MDKGFTFGRLHHVDIKRLLSFLGILTAVLALLLLFAYPYGNYLSIVSHENVGLLSLATGGKTFSNNSNVADSGIIPQADDALSSGDMIQMDSALEITEKIVNEGSTFDREGHANPQRSAKAGQFRGTTNISMAVNLSVVHNNESKIKDGDSLQVGSLFSTDVPVVASKPALRKRRGIAMSIAQMNSVLLNNVVANKSKRPRWSSRLDQKLQDAKFLIQNAPIQGDISEDHASLFRNYSMFKRSYELMETTLKVYVYKEGKKPIFHQPHMRGIYASEGWFMKLMERNKHFVVKDPKKAHLFYLPFSSVKLRQALNGSGFFGSQKYIENHLKTYLDTISTKYSFWNKRGGADHFLVACHDWAAQNTRMIFGNCIRALCNSNIAKGFQIGNDVSLPVTYIRSSENPSRDVGGNPPSNRPILAFFAGGMHGYVRPILLQHWHNKKPDMKIFGPMPRDDEGKAKYREFMKSSKYCICAKGYQVHTPRVVESIYYECVPVIISDNYVPPFFEVFDWESFALFVLEDDIPKLRDILLSVPDERYRMMQRRLKIVRRYFLWHKIPEKYDLFHMILHSVWHSRVLQFSG